MTQAAAKRRRSPRPRPTGREDRVTHNAAFAFATQIIGAVFTAGLTIFLSRALSPDAYGLFAFAFSVTLLASLFSDLGLSASAARFIAERSDDRPLAAQVFRIARRQKLLLASIVAALLFVLAAPISELFGSPGATWAVRGAAIALVGQSMFVLLFGSFAALGRQRYSTVLAFSESVVEVGACVALVLAGAGAAGAAFGRAVGFAVGMGVGLWVARHVIGRPNRRARRSRRAVTGQQILRYAGPLIVVDAAFRVFSAIDVLLISAIVGGGAAVAVYELPMRLIIMLDYPASAIASAVAPRLARRGDAEPDVALLGRSLRLLIVLQGVFLAPLVVWPEAIVGLLFGAGYEDAADVLRALVPFVFLSAVAQPVTLAVNYLGEARRRIPIAVAMLTVNVVIDVALLGTWGVVAAGVGTSAAYLVWVPAHLWILHRRAGLPLLPQLLCSARTLVAAAAMAGGLALLGWGDVGLGTLAVGAIVGPAIYVVALVLVGELRVRELAAIGAVVRRRGGASGTTVRL